MTAWWRALSVREQRLVLLAVAFVAIALAYLLGWRPLRTAIDRTQVQVQGMQSDLAWMRGAARRLEANGRGGEATHAPIGGSLLEVVDHVSGAQGTRTSMTRLSQHGSGQVQVEMKRVSFARFLHWLDALRGQGIRASSMEITPVEPGTVAVNLVLERATQQGTSP